MGWVNHQSVTKVVQKSTSSMLRCFHRCCTSIRELAIAGSLVEVICHGPVESPGCGECSGGNEGKGGLLRRPQPWGPMMSHGVPWGCDMMLI